MNGTGELDRPAHPRYSGILIIVKGPIFEVQERLESIVALGLGLGV